LPARPSREKRSGQKRCRTYGSIPCRRKSWKRIPDLAKAALAAFAWPCERPPPSTPTTALQKALMWQAAYAKGVERADEAAEALAARPADALWSSLSASSLDEDLGRSLWQ
jgi:hypothetical protein